MLGCSVGLPVVLPPAVIPPPFELALVPRAGSPFEFVLCILLSLPVSYRLSAALIRASAGVKLGIVKYLCLKNTVSQMRECLVLVM